jgi:ankyrin repeat protein
LFGAVQWGWSRVAQYLIAHGAKVDIKDDAGVSPLDVAMGQGKTDDNRPSPEMAKMLQTALAK